MKRSFRTLTFRFEMFMLCIILNSISILYTKNFKLVGCLHSQNNTNKWNPKNEPNKFCNSNSVVDLGEGVVEKMKFILSLTNLC